MILFLSYLYFLMPKIDLIQFSFSPTGLRIQDLVALLMTLLLPMQIKMKLIKAILVLTFLAIPGIIVGLHYIDSVQIFFGFFRLIEYLCIAFCLFYLFNQNKIYKLLLNCVLIHLLFGFFQYLQLVPLIDPGRGIFYSKQFAGLMGNPAELTYFFIAALPIIQQQKKLIILPIKFLIILNQVKVGVLSLIVTNYIKTTVIIGIFFILIDYFTTSLLSEVYNFFKHVIQLEVQNISLNEIKRDGLDVYEGERSLAQRAYKWWNVIGFLYHNNFPLFFGTGYGSVPGATDGGLIKMLLELGFFYLSLILIIFLRAGTQIFLIFLICNFMFDGYTSSVVAPILFMYLIIPKSLKFNQK